MPDDALRLLLIDDSAFDAQLLEERLQRDGLDCRLQRVDTEQAFRSALPSAPDLIFSEIELYEFSARRALAVLRETGTAIPLIVVTDIPDEPALVALVREGAVDYVLKTRLGRLTQSLRLAVERSHLLARLDDKRRDMASLSLRLVNAQEDERKNLARELHDELGQRLSALNLLLHRARPNLEATAGADLWHEAEHELSALVGLVRSMSVSLRPPGLDFFGLESTVRQLLKRQFHDGPTWVFEYAGLPRRLPPALEISVYRLVQESVTNIVRHARAGHVVVEINGGAAGEELELIVRDDGAGFDAARWREHAASALSSGLSGMSERVQLLGGVLDVDSAPGRGTRIAATLPLSNGAIP
jgi:signal transduction histidine kinase